MDSLPTIVAEDKNYFSNEGVNIDIISYQDSVQINNAFASGKVDIVITDLVAAMSLRNSGIKLQVISSIRGGAPLEGRVVLVSSPRSGIDNIEQLRGKSIVMPGNSILEFVTDQFLAAKDIYPEEIDRRPAKSLPETVRVLMNSDVAAATLPEPLATFAELQGCKVLADDIDNSLCYLVLVAHQCFVEAYPESITKFMTAYNHAVKEINAEPNAFRPTLLKIASLPSTNPKSFRASLLTMAKAPKGMKQIIPVPHYSYQRVPSPEEVTLVSEWLKSKGLISKNIYHQDLVTTQFVGS